MFSFNLYTSACLNLGEVLFTKSFSLINISSYNLKVMFLFLYFGLIPLPYRFKGEITFTPWHPIFLQTVFGWASRGRYEWTHEIVPVKAPRLSQRLRFLTCWTAKVWSFFFLSFFVRSRLKHSFFRVFSSCFLDSCIFNEGRIIYFKKAFLEWLFFATIWANYKCVKEVHWGSWCNGLTNAILGPFPLFQSTEPGGLRCITVLHINYSRLYQYFPSSVEIWWL